MSRAYENRLNRDGSRYFSAEAGEYADINERLGNLPPDSDRRGTLPQFFRLSPPVDLDNDGRVDNLVGWRPVGGLMRGQGQYEPTPHRGPTYLLFLDSKGDLDTTRTCAVFGHPGGNDLIWRDPRSGKVEVVRNPAFRSIGSGLDVIRFQGETFFDTFYDSRTRLSGRLIEEQEARVLGDTLAGHAVEERQDFDGLRDALEGRMGRADAELAECELNVVMPVRWGTAGHRRCGGRRWPASSRRSKPTATPAHSGRPWSRAFQQEVVHLVGGQAATPAFGEVVFEAGALLGGGGQFVEAVGELDAFTVELESRCDSPSRWGRGERGRPARLGIGG